MGGSTTISSSEPRINGFQVQKSAYGVAIPLMWGRTRLSANLLDYLDFVAIAETTTQSAGGKGGGEVKQQTTTYTYQAAIVLGLCEGPVPGVTAIYRDKESYFDDVSGTALAKAGFSFATGAVGQPVWPYLTSSNPTHAIGYSQTALVYAASYLLDGGARLQNHSFEVSGKFQVGSLSDANPSQIVIDFLSNPFYGVPGWPAGLIGNLADYSNYCLANNLLISPALQEQRPASQVLQEWMEITNSAIVYSENVLKVVPFGDAPATGNGATYTPNLTPVASLTDDDFLADDDEDPVKLQRDRVSDLTNYIEAEHLDRSRQYNFGIVRAFDQAHIEVYGLLKGEPLNWHCVCDPAVGRAAIELRKNRVLFRPNSYSFRLGWVWARLEPMDLLQITDVGLGLYQRLVRIVEVEEDDSGSLTIMAEDALPGSGSGTIVGSAGGQGMVMNTGSDPGNVATPALFTGPTSLTNGEAELWCAVAGVSAAWGGAEVWASLTGSNYARIGTISGPARYGVLTASLLNVADPDTTSTLAVNLGASKGAIFSGTQVDADSGNTLCLVDSELLTYRDATLTGAFAYNLTNLRRGFNNTAVATHANGARFVRLDGSIFRYPYAPGQVGQTLRVKFRSFNVFGQRLQDLAAATEYTVVIGTPPPDLTGFSAAVNGNMATFTWNPVTALQVLNGGFVVIRYSSATTGATWETASEVLRAPGNATQINGSYATGTYLAKLLDNAGQYSQMAVALGGAAGGGGGTLTATASPTSLSGSGSNSTVTTSSAATVSATGGATPYTYAWSRVSGDSTINAVNVSSASTRFSATDMTGAGDSRSAVFKCTVTDSTPGTAQTAMTGNVSVTLMGRDPPTNCVHVASYLPQHGCAGETKPGEHLMTGDQVTLSEGWQRVTHSHPAIEPCVRVTTERGALLVCTENAPLVQRAGLLVAASESLGAEIAIRVPGFTGYDLVVSVEILGLQTVQRLSLSDRCFWAGEQPDHFILHHNIKP